MSATRISTGLAWLAMCLAASVASAQIAGDYNKDGQLDAADLNLQAVAIITSDDPVFDLNNDSLLNFEDREVWVYDLKRTWFGDANLDLEFTSSDLVQVFQRGKYETGEDAGWEEGDWNGDLKFTSTDFVTSFAVCAYETCGGVRPPRVPEPSALTLLAIGMLGLTGVRRRTNKWRAREHWRVWRLLLRPCWQTPPRQK